MSDVMEDEDFFTDTDCSSASEASDYFQKLLTSAGDSKVRLVTVKFNTQDGKVFTQSYSENVTIGEIKTILVDVFAISESFMVMQYNKEIVEDHKHLSDFNLGNYDSIEFDLLSTKSGKTISADAAYQGFAVPDIITVRVDDSDDEEGFHNVVVEIEDRAIVKPFLGGYINKETGIEYHHGYSQTGPANPKIPPEKKNHRDAQTSFWRNRLTGTSYTRGTQMTNKETCIPNITDKILMAGPYETADEREKRLDVLNKVKTIQRYFRAWKICKALKELSSEYQKRIQTEREFEEFLIKDDAEQKRRELIAKVFPCTKTDFVIVYAMVDRWKKAEIKRICDNYSGAAKITNIYMLLDKEIQMLRSIEHHRQQVILDAKIQKERDFFITIGKPLAWNHRFDKWTGGYEDLYIEMDTLETQKGNLFLQMYDSISSDNLEFEDRLQGLLNIKLFLHDHNCQLANELVDLIERACQLMVRGIKDKHLDGLMKRIRGLFLQHVKDPECSFGVTTRMQRVREKNMKGDLHFCVRCRKLKTQNQFVIDSHTENLLICSKCSFDDRVMEPWVNLGPFRYILRLIRRDERMKQAPSSIAFILNDRDIYHIVVKIWHARSAITQKSDISVYDLRLCRWFYDQVWSPWNCILLTEPQARIHLQIKDVTSIYDEHFIKRVFNKHELAKNHFKKALKLEKYFQEMGEEGTRWNEIKYFKNFVAVNSKEKLFLQCH